MSLLSQFPEGAAVVIGGSGGIGGAICQGLAEAGTDVAFTYHRNADAAQSLAAALQAAGRSAHPAALDITRPEAVTSFFADVAARFGRIHTVVLAIGSDISMTYVADIDATEWSRT